MEVNLAYTKRKVEEERERCAKIADEEFVGGNDGAYFVAKAIRAK